MNDGPVLIVFNTRTDNLKIRFNASLASCVSIENTYAPLLVLFFSGGGRERNRHPPHPLAGFLIRGREICTVILR